MKELISLKLRPLSQKTNPSLKLSSSSGSSSSMINIQRATHGQTKVKITSIPLKHTVRTRQALTLVTGTLMATYIIRVSSISREVVLVDSNSTTGWATAIHRCTVVSVVRINYLNARVTWQTVRVGVLATGSLDTSLYHTARCSAALLAHHRGKAAD